MKIIKKIDVNEISKWSSWPARLLGLSEWNNIKRDASKIESEYDKDKYGKTLVFFNKSKKKPTMEALKQFEYHDYRGTVCVSSKEKLLITKAEDALGEYYKILAREVLSEIKDGDAVVELGCGYGFNLDLLKKKSKKDIRFFGGEFSQNAVNLGQMYFKNVGSDIKLSQFDFYDKEYKLFENIDGPIVIFTAHAIEQIPDISNMFRALRKYKSKIRSVVHLEPTYELHDDSLLGLMRKRYAEVNDYSRNLIGALEDAGDVKVLSVQKNFFGLNPLNVSSIVKWKFKK